MTSARLARVSVLALLPLLACREPVAVQGAISLQTDQPSYVAIADTFGTARFTVVLTLTNNSGDPVYLSRCGPAQVGPMYDIEPVVKKDLSGYSISWACVGGVRALALMREARERTPYTSSARPCSTRPHRSGSAPPPETFASLTKLKAASCRCRAARSPVPKSSPMPSG